MRTSQTRIRAEDFGGERHSMFSQRHSDSQVLISDRLNWLINKYSGTPVDDHLKLRFLTVIQAVLNGKCSGVIKQNTGRKYVFILNAMPFMSEYTKI
jgi:hypothetical protein